MIILAGTIIISLNNSGIIEKANEAVEQTNLANVKDIAQMAWANAYASGARTEEELKAAVDEALADSKTDADKYKIEVTTSGVTVELKGEEAAKWVQQGLTVTNGSVTLEIGDKIAYDETKGGTVEVAYDVEWQVLGASDEGDLLILATQNVDGLDLYDDYSGNPEEARNGWLKVVSTLDGLCEPYGKGVGAAGIRSITLEDIDKITGYDKTTFGTGERWEYGLEHSYYSYYEEMEGMWYVTYELSNGASGSPTGFYEWSSESKIYFYNGTSFDETTVEELNGQTVKNTMYYYNLYELENVDLESKAYKMIMTGDYWLATTYTLR